MKQIKPPEMIKNRQRKPAVAPDAHGMDLLEDLVPVRIMRIADIVSRLATQGFQSRFDLRNTDFRILNLLDYTQGMTVNEIARRTHVDKAWISRSLRQLSDKGLIKRGSDKNDSRLAVIRLTKYGQTLLDEIWPLATATEKRMLDGIESKAFKQDLERLIKNVEAMLGSGASTPSK
jgi:DNA-binding MarR family transcriptional regulator